MSPGRVAHPLLVRCLAEVLGTGALVGVGVGAIVAGVRVGGVSQGVLAIAWSFAVALPVLVFSPISGAHLNPAVTLTLVRIHRFPASEAVSYALSQTLGAFLGAATVLATLGGGAHLGSTIPAGGNLVLTFLLEVPFTTALLASVIYLTRPEKTVHPVELLLPAAVVGVSTYLIGPITGSSLNPARSLAPAVLSGSLGGLWVYGLSALTASMLAGALYQIIRAEGGESQGV